MIRWKTNREQALDYIERIQLCHWMNELTFCAHVTHNQQLWLKFHFTLCYYFTKIRVDSVEDIAFDYRSPLDSLYGVNFWHSSFIALIKYSHLRVVHCRRKVLHVSIVKAYNFILILGEKKRNIKKNPKQIQFVGIILFLNFVKVNWKIKT